MANYYVEAAGVIAKQEDARRSYLVARREYETAPSRLAATDQRFAAIAAGQARAAYARWVTPPSIVDAVRDQR